MPPVPPRRRRARPVADAPIDALLDRSDELAKGWLLALLEQAPLDEALGIVGAGLNRDGPRICEAVLRALSGESDLRRLEPGGALVGLVARSGELTGAVGPAAVARSVDALHAVTWSALRDELRRPDPDLVTELAERLALIAELVRAAALEHEPAGGPPVGPGPGTRRIRPVDTAARPVDAGGRPGDGSSRPVTPAAGAPGGGHVSPPAPPAPVQARPRPEFTARRMPSPAQAPDSPVEEPRPFVAPDAPAEVPSAPQRVWPDDALPAAGGSDALWIGALEEEILRSAGSGLSLLLAELEDADHVAAVESPSAAAATFGRFSAAVRSAVRRQDILVCETDSRAWVIARNTSHEGAHALADRIANALRRTDGWRGAPLTAGVGVAVLGADGRTGAELIEAAEEARFRASASGGAPDGAPWDQ